MRLLLVVLIGLLLSGCISGLNENQARKLEAIKQTFPEQYHKEKSPSLGILLGFLPGGGSFYTGHVGTGIANFILYPLGSFLWDPINGYNGAQERNYYSSISALNRAKDKELSDLDDKLAEKAITSEEYTVKSRKVEKKYNIDALL